MADTLNDRELQSLRNDGNEAERATDEIVALRAEVERLRAAPAPVALTPAQQHADELARLLEEVSEQRRHPDYDWPLHLSREVSAVLAAIEATGKKGGAA